MAGSLEEVIRQMQARGIDVPPRVDLSKAFDTYHRWRPSCEPKAKKSAWARLFEYRSDKGRIFITGAYGWRGDTFEVEASATDWSPAERAEWQEQRKAAQKAAEEARAKDAESAADKARRLWDKARDEGRSPYLDRKRVHGFGVRFMRDLLLVPLRDMDGNIHGLQYLGEEKKFGSGTVKAGRFHLIGEVGPGQPLCFAEGYATGATVHMAQAWPTVVCFDAGNLELVMAQWRKLYPDVPFVIAGDDDRHLVGRLCERLAKVGVSVTVEDFAKSKGGLRAMEWELHDGTVVSLRVGMANDASGVGRLEGSITVDGQAQIFKIENAGRAKAMAAAKKHGAIVLFPAFQDRASPHTDWNDLHVSEGLDACADQLLKAFEAGGVPTKKRDGAPQGPSGGKVAKADKPPADPSGPRYINFLERYTLIYGTTTVWDEEVRQVIRVESLKLAHGKLVDWWLDHEERRMVPQDRVVFDPTGKFQPPQYVNLFAGLPLEPNPNASCVLIVQHLFNICQENDALFHWVACWLALPLQQLGTKMHTALVLHGRTEGTGKTLLTTIMRRIYGVHSRTINQRQLETEFNAWMSGQMFVVAEEVVSRQDRAHLQGILQDMVTGEVVNINEKNMPLRTEASYANFVFQSNQQVPVLLNKTDRRHTVIRVEREHPEAYFDAILEEMSNGGIEAFYDWLLKYDVGDFSKRTKPFRNRDRMHLITLGMSPDQRFFHHWESGVAGVPFVCCPSSDLYTAFKAWCKVSGERFVANQTAFSRTVAEELERLGAPEKKKVRYWAYSDKAVIDGDWNEVQVRLQAVVFYVHAAIERRGLGGGDEEEGTEAPPAGDGQAVDGENVTDPIVCDKRIKLFQAALHTLIGSARRAL